MTKSISGGSFIRIFSIEHEYAYARGLQCMFRPERDHITFAGNADNINAAIQAISKIKVDVILLDLYLRPEDPIENVKKLKEVFNATPIIIFSKEDSDDWRKKMYKSKVSAFVVKSFDVCEIKSIIRKVAAGMVIIEYSKVPQEQRSRYAYLRKNFDFTDFQIEVLELCSQSFREEEISKIMKVSVKCIARSLRQMRTISGARTTPELIKRALI